MSSKAEKERQRQIQERCQTLLSQMLRDDDNKYCVDCDAKGPRWASWNLGIFLCIRCAGIHRNLGVHISKVKSVNLDSWTPEQVVRLQQMGNSRARAVYEANLPDNFRRPQTDSALEAFIRAKYEANKYIASEWVPPPPPKVNWDKELDEEEKARKKKRESKNPPAIATVPVKKVENIIPAPLPKPNTSPKPQRSSNATMTVPPVSSATTDLLGLDTPEKPTAPSIGATPASLATRSEEEENFFNQPSLPGAVSTSSASQQQNKMTTDSILALYSKVPQPSPFQSAGPSLMSHPGGMMPTQPVFGAPLANGHTIQQAPAQVFPPRGGVVAASSNPFFSMGGSLGGSAPIGGLQQQMNSLNLGNPSAPPNHHQTFANNLWQ